MAFHPSQTDLMILKNPAKAYRIRVQVLDSRFKAVDELEGVITDGSISCDTSSNNRRTASLSVFLKDPSYDISRDSRLWLNKFVKIFIGSEYQRTHEVHWYTAGIFLFDSAASSCDKDNRTIQLECSDLMSLLDGTMNGEQAALVTKIPQGGKIRDAFISILTQLGGVTDYHISEMGTYYGCIGTESEKAAYREAHSDWDEIPYDLEFDASDTVFSMLSELLKLYAGWEMYFDEEGVFHCRMIPTLAEDDPVLDADFLDPVVISIQRNSDFSTIRNAVHIWGKCFDCDRYSETVALNGSTYTAEASGYTSYAAGDKLAFVASADSPQSPSLSFGAAGARPILEESTDEGLPAGALTKGQCYVVKCKANALYLLGQYQVEAMVILCGKEPDESQKKRWDAQFGCKNTRYVINPESPYTWERIGLRLKSESGGEYDDITSDSLALSRAQYDLTAAAMWQDTVSLTCVLIPWLLNCNQKITCTVGGRIYPYITKSAGFSFSDCTMSLTASRFYPMYSDIISTYQRR